MDDKEQQKNIKSEVQERTVTLILAGFGLVAALAWNDAIQSLFAEIFGSSPSSITAKFFYALLVTVIITIISSRLGRIANKN